MFPIRMFCNGLFAPRMFPKVGQTAAFQIAWGANVNKAVGLNIEPK